MKRLIIKKIRLKYFILSKIVYVKNKLLLFRYKLIYLLLTENERYMLTQSINEGKEAIIKDLNSGLIGMFEARYDLDLLDKIKVICKNDLWK